MITADFSGQELRILAEESQEPVWLNAFRNYWDVHSVVAEMMYGQKWTDAAADDCAYFNNDHKKCGCPEHKKLRNAVKAINFGIAYGMTYKKLSEELGISQKDAKHLLEIYYKALPVLIRYLSDSGKSATKNLISTTICGRVRHYIKPTFDLATVSLMKEFKVQKERQNDPSYVKAFQAQYSEKINKAMMMMFFAIEREGKNAVIQGTGADMLKVALNYLWHEIDSFGGLLENNVYDEILVEVPEENVDKAVKVINDCMVRAGNDFVKTIPFETEIHVEDYWCK
jgi:DNA polymerase-1